MTNQQKHKLEVIEEMTKRHLKKADPVISEVIKKVFVLEVLSIFEACDNILKLSSLQAFDVLKKWFESYDEELWQMIPDEVLEEYKHP